MREIYIRKDKGDYIRERSYIFLFLSSYFIGYFMISSASDFLSDFQIGTGLAFLLFGLFLNILQIKKSYRNVSDFKFLNVLFVIITSLFGFIISIIVVTRLI